MVLLIGDFVCTSLVVVALVLFLGFLLVPKLIQYRRDRGRDKLMAIAVILVLMVGLSAYAGSIYAEYREWMEEKELVYVVNVTAAENASGTLWVPVSGNAELQRSLEVVAGTGTFGVVGTDRGRALGVDYEGNLTVRGVFVTTGGLGNWTLTMLEDDRWVTKRDHWMRLERGGGEAPSVEVVLERHEYDEDDWFLGETEPGDGWGTFVVRFWHDYRYYGGDGK